jgi:hypothetical protein
MKNVTVSRCNPNPMGQPAFFLSVVLSENSFEQFHATQPARKSAEEKK